MWGISCRGEKHKRQSPKELSDSSFLFSLYLFIFFFPPLIPHNSILSFPLYIDSISRRTPPSATLVINTRATVTYGWEFSSRASLYIHTKERERERKPGDKTKVTGRERTISRWGDNAWEYIHNGTQTTTGKWRKG